MRLATTLAVFVLLASTPALADNLTFNACGTGWVYQAKGNNPTVEWFGTSLQSNSGAIFVQTSPTISTPALSGQVSGGSGNFDLDLPMADLPGLQATILQHHYFYVTLSYHAGTGGNSQSQVLDNFSVNDTNGQPKPPCL